MKVKRPDLSLLKKIFLVDLIKGLLLTFSYQRPSENYTEQYPKDRAEDCRAIPRRAAIEQRSRHRGDALHCLQSLRAGMPGALHRSGLGARSGRKEGAHDLHVRYVAMHVLRALRRCMSDAVPGTDAGL